MELKTTIEITDNPPLTFRETIAGMNGNDGSSGSISLICAPVVDPEHPTTLCTRVGSIVQFEHEGRHGNLDLTQLFQEWVEAIGDRPEDDPSIHMSEEEMAQKRFEEREQRKAEFLAEHGKGGGS